MQERLKQVEPVSAGHDKIDALESGDHGGDGYAALSSLIRPDCTAGAAWYDRMAARFAELRAAAEQDPLANPVQSLAGELMRAMLSGELDGDSLQSLIRLLRTESIIARASRHADYVLTVDPDENDRRLRSALQQLVFCTDGSKRGFDDFQSLLGRELFGIVLTAHPTFLLPSALWPEYARLVAHIGGAEPMPESAQAELLAAIAAVPHGYVGGITLDDEHQLSVETIERIQDALHRFLGLLFDVAAEHYPDDWHRLRPRPFTLASWVGYDLDGRSDIRWSDTYRARLIVQQHQLDRYLERLRLMRRLARADRPVDTMLKLLETRLAFARHVAADDLSRLPAMADDGAAVQAFGRAVAQHGDERLTDTAELLGLLDDAIAECAAAELRRALSVFRAEMAMYGLGMAHTHVRLNATQISNALRGEFDTAVDLEHHAGRRKRARMLGELLDHVLPQTVSFGSVMYERTSAKRLFMLVAQMLKHIDGSVPVRFLIAECEEASTVLAALYFARQFDIADKLDISPLFETEAALQRGDALIAELLESPHYRNYISRRGRLCVQTGFSDAGRYLGQVAASLAIERLRIKLARLLASHGLQDIQLVIFDTHGESIGRGAHPASFADRLDHVFPPVSRAYFRHLGITVKQETSFQGGDGFLFFASPEMAYATLARMLERGLAEAPEVAPVRASGLPMTPSGIEQVTDDPFYLNTDYSLDFFIALADFNQRLVDDPHYAALLGMFGANLMYATGSRAVKRQHEKGGRAELVSASQIRAIPHNAVLQQMGYLANSCGGIGRAICRDQERFWEVYQHSPRCQQFMDMVERAFVRSDLDAFLAYVGLIDPAHWLRLAMQDRRDPEAYEALAQLFRQTGRYARVWDAAQVLVHDALQLREALAARRRYEARSPLSSSGAELLPLVHALRIAMIQAIFVLVTRIPRFTSQPDITLEDVRNQLLRLDVEPALAALARAFPAQVAHHGDEDYGEAASYRSDSQRGYDHEHRDIFQPIGEYYDLVRQASSVLANLIGAVG